MNQNGGIHKGGFAVLCHRNGGSESPGILNLKNTYEEGIQKGMRTGQYKGRQQKAYQTARNLYRRGFSIKDTAGILEEDEKMVAAWFKKWETKRGR